jgi:hypothetical protein
MRVAARGCAWLRVAARGCAWLRVAARGCACACRCEHTCRHFCSSVLNGSAHTEPDTGKHLLPSKSWPAPPRIQAPAPFARSEHGRAVTRRRACVEPNAADRHRCVAARHDPTFGALAKADVVARGARIAHCRACSSVRQRHQEPRAPVSIRSAETLAIERECDAVL